MKPTTRTNLEYTLGWLDQYLKGQPLHKVNKHMIEKIALAKEKENCCAVTVNTVLRKVRVILKKACNEWEWIDKVPPIKFRKEPPARVRWESPEALGKAIAHCPEHQRNPILFALATGLRKSNVAGLQKAWIDKEHSVCTIPAKYYKNGEPHTVALNTLAMDIVESEWDKHPTHLFTYRGKPIKDLGTKAWRNALAKADIKNFRWHDLRHTWASWLAQNGESLLTIKEAGGWRKMDMVSRYSHLSVSNMAKAASNLLDTKLSRLSEAEKKENSGKA